jgi:hypothetical protein
MGVAATVEEDGQASPRLFWYRIKKIGKHKFVCAVECAKRLERHGAVIVVEVRSHGWPSHDERAEQSNQTVNEG